MSKRLDAIKSIFTGKSYISSTPNMNSTVQSSTYVKVLNDFFGFYNNYDNRKFLASYGDNPVVYMVVNNLLLNKIIQYLTQSITSLIKPINLYKNGCNLPCPFPSPALQQKTTNNSRRSLNSHCTLNNC